MTSAPAPSNAEPPRSSAVPESYALHVTEEGIGVWQYRATLSDPEGAWHHVETLDHAADPRLALEGAAFEPPSGSGYWVYCRSYDCTLGCDGR